MTYPKKFAQKVLFAVLFFSLISTFCIYAASAETMTVKAEASPSQPAVGDTVTVTIKMADAQNLFGLDVTLDWNPSILEFVSATPQLGVESHAEGVLHESTSYPIEVDDNSHINGEYHLLATSTGASTASFSGSGTIATVTFKVVGSGSADLALDVELAQKGEVDVVVPGTLVDSVTAAIPEFPISTLILVLGVAATVTILAATKLHKKASPPTPYL